MIHMCTCPVRIYNIYIHIYINIYIYIYILIKTEIGSWHTKCSTCTKQRA